MKYFFSFVFLMIMLTGFTQPSDKIEWMDFEELNHAMEEQPKKVVLFFHGKGCVYCRKMEQAAFKNPEITAILNSDFYTVEMDVHARDTIVLNGHRYINPDANKSRYPIHELAAAFITREGHPISYPVTILLDKNFRIVNRSFEYLSPKALKKFIGQKP